MSSITNFYSLPQVQKYMPPAIEYANFPKVQIRLPVNMVVCGGTGSGKTNMIMYLLEQINAFTKIYIIAKNIKEPLYEWITEECRKREKKLHLDPGTLLFVTDKMEDLPEITTLDKTKVNLVIFDDWISSGKEIQEKIANYMIACRKYQTCAVYLVQDYFSVYNVIKNQCRIVVLTPGCKPRNLLDIMRNFTNIGLDAKQLGRVYRYATNGGMPNFLLIDADNPNENLRLRKGFVGIPVSASHSSSSSSDEPTASNTDKGQGQPAQKKRAV